MLLVVQLLRSRRTFFLRQPLVMAALVFYRGWRFFPVKGKLPYVLTENLFAQKKP